MRGQEAQVAEFVLCVFCALLRRRRAHWVHTLQLGYQPCEAGELAIDFLGAPVCSVCSEILQRIRIDGFPTAYDAVGRVLGQKAAEKASAAARHPGDENPPL